jgi:hypothetical protein
MRQASSENEDLALLSIPVGMSRADLRAARRSEGRVLFSIRMIVLKFCGAWQAESSPDGSLLVVVDVQQDDSVLLQGDCRACCTARRGGADRLWGRIGGPLWPS